jgi:hypothetical protein
MARGGVDKPVFTVLLAGKQFQASHHLHRKERDMMMSSLLLGPLLHFHELTNYPVLPATKLLSISFQNLLCTVCNSAYTEIQH